MGVDIFVEVLRQGRRTGCAGSPVAIETLLGWVLCGQSESTLSVPSFHSTVESKDDVLQRFWKIEEGPASDVAFSMEERSVLKHFNANHYRVEGGRFVVPLPKRSDAGKIGESRSQAARRFFSLERSLSSRNQFKKFESVMKEYMDLGHAELIPATEVDKPLSQVFYLPIHVVYKDSSTTTKIRAVFDASAKSTTGISLNDTLLTGPTVHSSLVDVLLLFRLNRIAVTADISKMYRAVELTLPDRDLHRFVWRSHPSERLRDYRMTRLTFGVSASSFAANMSIQQNAIDFADKYPLAAEVVRR